MTKGPCGRPPYFPAVPDGTLDICAIGNPTLKRWAISRENGAKMEIGSTTGNGVNTVQIMQGLTKLFLACCVFLWANLIFAQQLDPDSELIAAAQTGSLHDVRAALRNGANVDAKGLAKGETALMNAGVKGYSDIVKFLLDNGADVNQKGDHHETALILSSAQADSEIVKLLLQKGAEVNARANNNETALMFAATFGRVENCKALLQRGSRLQNTKWRRKHSVRLCCDERLYRGRKIIC